MMLMIVDREIKLLFIHVIVGRKVMQIVTHVNRALLMVRHGSEGSTEAIETWIVFGDLRGVAVGVTVASNTAHRAPAMPVK